MKLNIASGLVMFIRDRGMGSVIVLSKSCPSLRGIAGLITLHSPCTSSTEEANIIPVLSQSV